MRLLQRYINRLERTHLILIASVIVLALAATQAKAQGPGRAPAPAEGPLPLHPTFALLDAAGENVLETGEPVSTMRTCGTCHDTEFIASHNLHADAGLASFGKPIDPDHSWDSGSRLFGDWNPLTYRYLSADGDEPVDITTAEWVQLFGSRHAGGGPATTGRDGETPLTALSPDASLLETGIIDPESGELLPWDWDESGVVEVNCFLCHTAAPNNEARIDALQAGRFGWAGTATLVGTGIVEPQGDGWAYNPEMFDELGNVDPAQVGIQDPTSQNCAACHGTVHSDAQVPLVAETCSVDAWTTYTTGQIISPQKIANTGLNIEDKEMLARSWDIHAERVLSCVDCHYSANNPVYFQQPEETRPEHLMFDPRRIDFGEYLYRPVHELAGEAGADAGNSSLLRTCESCHSIAATHNWLPYKERHTSVLSCETCHIPSLEAPALEYVDWTVLTDGGAPRSECRGVDGDIITGFEPALLPQEAADGSVVLAPYNLVSAWYWVYGDPARPVPLRDLQAAWLENGAYPAEIREAFDSNGDGRLDSGELVIDSEAKSAVIIRRLEARGLADPRIVGEVLPYEIHHNVAGEGWATRACDTCHTEESRVTAPFPLSDRTPGGVVPTFLGDIEGGMIASHSAALYLMPEPVAGTHQGSGIYILGHDSIWWIDWLGIVLLLGTLLAVTAHGGLRYLAARRLTHSRPELRSVYMYSVYERLWHWLQTAVILLLIFTGLVIHKPDKLGIFSFTYMVQVHNVLAALLVINAALALFYHLASGEIQQFLPRPYGFFDQAIVQARFYLQGIFSGAEHPFEKTTERKLNPLQQVTYLMILNVLLPLQIISGLLMWGAQHFPDVTARAGGLAWLAPLHTLVAWLFATFIVAHVYLTTTGYEPLAGIKAMIMGWDEVEVHHPSPGTDLAREEQ